MKKKANSKQNLAVLSAATGSEYKIIQILHRKGQNKIWTETRVVHNFDTLQ